MKKSILLLLPLIISVLISGSAAGYSETAMPFITVGYCEGEAYYEFDSTLRYIILGLDEYGLISLPEKEPLSGDSKAVWSWISSLDQSSWDVRFSEDVFFSLTDERYSGMDEEQLSLLMDQAITSAHADLILAMGTVAGLKIKSLDSEPQMMCFAAADAVKSGIVKGELFSQIFGIWAQMDTDSFKRSITVMDDIFSPQKVGVVYEDSEDAYIYSGVDVLDEFCEANGIEVVRQYVSDPITDGDYAAYLENLSAAYEALSKEVDVFVLTTSLVDSGDFAALLEPFYREHVPVYSINSAEDVEFGALMAAESSDYLNVGRFGADTLRRYLNGELLENLPQVYQTAPFLVINYQTALQTGYNPSFNILLSANKIYNER